MAEISKWKPKLTGEVESFLWTDPNSEELLREFVNWYMGYVPEDFDRNEGAHTIPDMIYDAWQDQVMSYGLKIIDKDGSRMPVEVGHSIVRIGPDDFQVWSPYMFDINYEKKT